MLWTEERVSQLERWCAESLSAGQIAAMFDCGFTRNAIIGKVHRMGLKLNMARGKKATDVVQPNRARMGEPRTRRGKVMRYEVPTFVAPPDEPEPLRKTVLTPGFNDGCKWVCDGTDDNCLPVYCGHPSLNHSSWCVHHYRRVCR